MSHTFSCILVHLVFSTKDRAPQLDADFFARLQPYAAAIVNKEFGHARRIGGTEDHVHMLLEIKPTVCVADVARVVKANTSKWVHETFPKRAAFAWQIGYGAFSVSRSAAGKVASYIDRQKEHHWKMSFQEELTALLKRHGIKYDSEWL